jgi:hypothetical protein
MSDLPFVLSIAVGVVVGFVYVFQEYRGKPSNEISKNPRFRNLGVVIGPGLLGSVLDWKTLAGTTDVGTTKQAVLLTYSVAVAVTIATLMTASAVIVAFEAWRRNKQVVSGARILPLDAVGLFVTRGLTAYEEKALRLSRDASKDVLPNPVPVYAEAMRVALLAEKGFRNNQHDREQAIGDILKVIVDVTRAQLPDSQGVTMAAHWLRSAPVERLSSAERARLKFGSLDVSDCSEVLIAEQYGRGQSGEKYVLPVSDDHLRCLRGAPLAFRKEGVEAAATSEMKFASIEPKTTQAEMRKYFSDRARRSQLCIPLQRGAKMVGVAVIEANTDIFGSGNARVIEVGQSLHPFCFTLAALLPGDMP